MSQKIALSSNASCSYSSTHLEDLKIHAPVSDHVVVNASDRQSWQYDSHPSVDHEKNDNSTTVNLGKYKANNDGLSLTDGHVKTHYSRQIRPSSTEGVVSEEEEEAGNCRLGLEAVKHETGEEVSGHEKVNSGLEIRPSSTEGVVSEEEEEARDCHLGIKAVKHETGEEIFGCEKVNSGLEIRLSTERVVSEEEEARDCHLGLKAVKNETGEEIFGCEKVNFGLEIRPSLTGVVSEEEAGNCRLGLKAVKHETGDEIFSREKVNSGLEIRPSSTEGVVSEEEEEKEEEEAGNCRLGLKAVKHETGEEIFGSLTQGASSKTQELQNEDFDSEPQTIDCHPGSIFPRNFRCPKQVDFDSESKDLGPSNLDFSRVSQHFDPRSSYVPCTLCNKTFSSRNCLGSHLQKKHGKSLKESQEIVTYLKLPCLLCDRQFTSRYRLGMHYKRNHNMFACKLCPKLYKCSQGLVYHEMNNHCDVQMEDATIEHKKSGDQRPKYLECTIQCKLCHQTLSSRDSLKSHLQRMHRKSPKESQEIVDHLKLPCLLCDRKFGSRQYLAVHYEKDHNRLRLESREMSGLTKKFACKLCPKSYKTSQGLIHHEKKNHCYVEMEHSTNYAS